MDVHRRPVSSSRSEIVDNESQIKCWSCYVETSPTTSNTHPKVTCNLLFAFDFLHPVTFCFIIWLECSQLLKFMSPLLCLKNRSNLVRNEPLITFVYMSMDRYFNFLVLRELNQCVSKRNQNSNAFKWLVSIWPFSEKKKPWDSLHRVLVKVVVPPLSPWPTRLSLPPLSAPCYSAQGHEHFLSKLQQLLPPEVYGPEP